VAIKSTLKGHYQLACLTMINGDLSQTPLGSNQEPLDDVGEAMREGIYVYVSVYICMYVEIYIHMKTHKYMCIFIYGH
jgi:hypothetical protein